jgi:hypothetical protein
MRCINDELFLDDGVSVGLSMRPWAQASRTGLIIRAGLIHQLHQNERGSVKDVPLEEFDNFGKAGCGPLYLVLAWRGLSLPAEALKS